MQKPPYSCFVFKKIKTWAFTGLVVPATGAFRLDGAMQLRFLSVAAFDSGMVLSIGEQEPGSNGRRWCWDGEEKGEDVWKDAVEGSGKIESHWEIGCFWTWKQEIWKGGFSWLVASGEFFWL